MAWSSIVLCNVFPPANPRPRPAPSPQQQQQLGPPIHNPSIANCNCTQSLTIPGSTSQFAKGAGAPLQQGSSRQQQAADWAVCSRAASKQFHLEVLCNTYTAVVAWKEGFSAQRDHDDLVPCSTCIRWPRQWASALIRVLGAHCTRGRAGWSRVRALRPVAAAQLPQRHPRRSRGAAATAAAATPPTPARRRARPPSWAPPRASRWWGLGRLARGRPRQRPTRSRRRGTAGQPPPPTARRRQTAASRPGPLTKRTTASSCSSSGACCMGRAIGGWAAHGACMHACVASLAGMQRAPAHAAPQRCHAPETLIARAGPLAPRPPQIRLSLHRRPPGAHICGGDPWGGGAAAGAAAVDDGGHRAAARCAAMVSVLVLGLGLGL